jgi:hypothetical protein
MSDDDKGLREPAAKLTTSEKWGDPPIWSPWNFQYVSPNREQWLPRNNPLKKATDARTG